MSAIFNWIPFAGGFFSAVIGILTFIFWIILMTKTYQGELYKVPVAGQVAEGILPVSWRVKTPDPVKEQKSSEPSSPDKVPESLQTPEAPSPVISGKMEDLGARVENYFTRSRAARITGYGAVIVWNVVLIIFFSFFHRYIAWYQVDPDGSVARQSMLTNDCFLWLPILATALIISVAAHIILIVYDSYWFRETVQIILNVIGIAVVANLISIFPL